VLDVLLQTLRNPDHLVDFAMGDSAANVITAHVPLFPERIEGADEPALIKHASSRPGANIR